MPGMFGSSVNPNPQKPTVGPDTQNAFFNALFGTGLTQKPDGGWEFNKTVDPSQLPNVTVPTSPVSTLAQNNWQPWNGGLSYLANSLYGSKASGGIGNPNAADPNLQMLAQTGGTGGPGSAGEKDLQTYGSASKDVGQWMHDLAQFGAAGPAGQMESNISQGFATGPAAYLAPFLKSGTSQPYNAPNVVMKPVQGGI